MLERKDHRPITVSLPSRGHTGRAARVPACVRRLFTTDGRHPETKYPIHDIDQRLAPSIFWLTRSSTETCDDVKPSWFVDVEHFHVMGEKMEALLVAQGMEGEPITAGLPAHCTTMRHPCTTMRACVPHVHAPTCWRSSHVPLACPAAVSPDRSRLSLAQSACSVRSTSSRDLSRDASGTEMSAYASVL